MAQHVNVRLVDDLDGSAASETVSFGLDGRQFEIDLSAGNAEQLRDALASYVAAARRGDTNGARRPRATRGPRPAASGGENTSEIRDWARTHGHEVSDRGRISKAVLDAYANRDVPAPVEEKPKKARKSRKVAD